MGIICSRCRRTPLDCDCVESIAREERGFFWICVIVLAVAATLSYLTQ